MPKANVRRVVCGNCEWSGTEDEVSVEDCEGLQERLTPGDEVPAGDCPKCGAFCYLCKPARIGALSAVAMACLLFVAPAFAGESKLEGKTLTITLDTAGQHHTTKRGAVVLDTIKGQLPDGSRFQARVYRPAPKGIVPCTTDTDCEEKNPGIK